MAKTVITTTAPITVNPEDRYHARYPFNKKRYPNMDITLKYTETQYIDNMGKLAYSRSFRDGRCFKVNEYRACDKEMFQVWKNIEFLRTFNDISKEEFGMILGYRNKQSYRSILDMMKAGRRKSIPGPAKLSFVIDVFHVDRGDLHSKDLETLYNTGKIKAPIFDGVYAAIYYANKIKEYQAEGRNIV